MKGKNIFVVGVIGIILAIIGYLFYSSLKPSKLDAFATCLKDKGVKFYGAFWCPHCQNQTKMFGSSEKNLPYIECSTPNGNDQLPICKDEHVSSYPTWKFPDGTVQTGEVPLQDLATKSNCSLP